MSGIVFALALVLGSPLHAQRYTMNRHALVINSATIRGIAHIVQLKPAYATPDGREEVISAFSRDGYDEILFVLPDSTLWLAYGKHISLYTRTAEHVRSASVRGQPTKVLYIDDENREGDPRRAMGKIMLTGLILVVAGGLAGGITVGVLARRSFSGIGRDPLIDRAVYGLILGLLAALLIYGLSNRKLDFRGLVTHTSETHLRQFMIGPPSE